MKKYSALFILLWFFAAAPELWAAPEDPVRVKVKVYRRTEPLVHLSPNPTFTGAVELRSESKDPVHFYVFDVAGTMVYHTLLMPHTRRTINELKKGTYSYDVFLFDESVEQGKISVMDQRKNARQVK